METIVMYYMNRIIKVECLMYLYATILVHMILALYYRGIYVVLFHRIFVWAGVYLIM
jgi:hypothetical protein